MRQLPHVYHCDRARLRRSTPLPLLLPPPCPMPLGTGQICATTWRPFEAEIVEIVQTQCKRFTRALSLLHSNSVSLLLSLALSALEIRLQIERIICSATAFWQRDTPPSAPSPAPPSLLDSPCYLGLVYIMVSHTHTRSDNCAN